METMLVIIGLLLVASLCLALLSSIFYVATQGLVDVCEALYGVAQFFKRFKRG